jgi:hypothetical protein
MLNAGSSVSMLVVMPLLVRMVNFRIESPLFVGVDPRVKNQVTLQSIVCQP